MITPSDLRRRPSRSRDSTESSGLHWLRAKKRITFKLCLLVNKAINGLAPSYLQDLCVPVTTVYARSALRSAARWDVVPRTRRRLGNRAFCVAGPTAWNSLPPDIRTALSLITFKNLLKTHLFIQHSILLCNVIRVSCAVRRPCSDFVDMFLSFYYYYYYYYHHAFN